MSKIEMRGVLPRYPEDDVEFVLLKLKDVQPCTIADLVRHIGAEARINGAPSPEYCRVQDAMNQAKEEGKVCMPKGRGSWRIGKPK